MYEGKQFIFAYERTYMLLIPSTERVKVREGRFGPLGSGTASAGPTSAYLVLAFPRKLTYSILLAQALSERAINPNRIYFIISVCQVSQRLSQSIGDHSKSLALSSV